MENKIMVIGAGLMGAGIAQVAAKAGYDVVLVDRTESDLLKARQQIEKSIALLTKKGVYLPQDGLELMERLHFTANMQDGKQAGLVIEAVPEKMQIKQAVFRDLDELMPAGTILASNTSSLSIAMIGAATRRPEHVIGMHFFSPVPVMKLLELIRSIRTSDETLQVAREAGERMGKHMIVAQDYPGFTVNRLLVPMMNEAAYLVMEGNDPEEIDKGMVYGANHPLGPLRLADNVGIDVLLFTLESLYEGFNDSKYRPCPLLKRMVEAGLLGKKSGRGFYTYS
ncbi:MAG: 3-hydroxyacyl-CoA dehydrogenase family protein [Clostridia bacterium]